MEQDIEEAQRARQDAATFEPPEPEQEFGMPYSMEHIAVVQEEVWQYLECECGDRLCQVEDGDTMRVLLDVARDHIHRHNEQGEVVP